MITKKSISNLATKYCQNKILRTIVRPLWRVYHNHERKKQIAKFHKNGRTLLEKVSSICIENNILFWLEFGTLLGAYRDHDFIAHDFDIDLGVMFDDRARFQDALLHGGFKLLREFRIIKNYTVIGLEQTYSYKSVMVDIFYHHIVADNMIKSYSFTPISNNENYKGRAEIIERTKPYKGFEKSLFKEIQVFIPANISEYLSNYYGINFMVPDPNYNYKKTLKNIIFYDREDMTAEHIEYEKIYL